MASIKRLKKDIDYLTFSVIADCLNYSFLSGKNDDEVNDIVQTVIANRNDLRDRINAAGKPEDKKARKSYYNSIFKDLLVNTDNAFTKLSGLVKTI